MTAKHKKTILNLALYTLALVLLCTLVPWLLKFFLPLVVGWVLAWMANPLVRFFEQHFKILRKHGSLLVIVGALALVVTACYFVIAWLVREAMDFAGSIPELYAAVRAGFGEIAENLSGLLAVLPASVQTDIMEAVANMDAYVGDLLGVIGSPALSGLGDIAQKIPNMLVMVIFALLGSYFFVADKTRISEAMDKLLPQSWKDGWTWLKGIFYRAVGGYFIAQFKIMGVIAVILYIGFKILHIQHAVLLALLLALLDFIPFLGTGTALWPWALFQLLTGDLPMAAGLMVIYCICLPVHQILQPKFVGDTVGLDPLWTLIFMFIGYRLSGMLGMIIAIPVGMMIVGLVQEGAFDQLLADVKDLVHDFNTYRKSG
ncbi:MAG: sporulation integral membrane protein YtvI [Oscillospiraceae bacterium]|nr:sporulation integral membrane protein YtvI [Oscillospiraceae bacterium]